MSQPGNLAGVSRIIAVHSAKGGVGKSTVTVNLAVSLAQRGFRVGLLDADVHGPSTPIMMGNSEWPDPGQGENSIHPVRAHGVSFISIGNMVTRETPLIWRGAMVHSVITQFLANVLWGELDFLLIDMPPGTGDAQLSISQSVPLTGALVVTTPQEFSVIDTVRGMRAFAQMKVPILGLIENMSVFVCDACGERAELFGESANDIVAEELNIPILGRLPIEPLVCEGGDAGKPFVLAAPESVSAKAMDAISGRFLALIENSAQNAAFRLEWETMDWGDRRPDPPEEEIAGSPLRAVWQVSGDELGLAWSDGEVSIIGTRKLRLACPCAACVEEFTGKPLLDPETVPGNVTIATLVSVGRYGLQPTFTDGHRTGIYSFERLREIVCQKA